MRHVAAFLIFCILFLTASALADDYSTVLAELRNDPSLNVTQLQWAEADLDRNSTDELLVYRTVDDKLDILGVWTMQDDAPIELIHAADTVSCTLTYSEGKGYHIVMKETVSRDKTCWAFFQVDGSKLLLNDALIRDDSFSEVDPYLYAMDTSWDVSLAFPVTTAEATAMLAGYLHCPALENSHPLLSAE